MVVLEEEAFVLPLFLSSFLDLRKALDKPD